MSLYLIKCVKHISLKLSIFAAIGTSRYKFDKFYFNRQVRRAHEPEQIHVMLLNHIHPQAEQQRAHHKK